MLMVNLKEISMCDPTEAELVKYFQTHIMPLEYFANYFYEFQKLMLIMKIYLIII